ncbi:MULTISPECIES: T9SS type A sorting domain-containing protein [Chryseobacterium]|uniref:T9SS type A sorting domain-containing protein n=1 Tax=Chryseobacterium TaxID=59732 RepID=UPI0027D7CC8A|nr:MULTISPECIES: T9SS type A sorting domain-containing protein [Chryseobacterium]
MRKILFVSLMLLSLWSWGQATLPFTYDGGRSGLPTGLSQTGLGTDYNNSPKMKFDDSGDFVVLNFTGAGSTLSYKISNNGISGNFKFQILQSADGTNYTSIRDITTLSSGSTIFTDNVSSSAKYIKWVYTTKATGNIGLGAINLSAQASDPNLSISGTASNGSVCPNTAASAVTYTITNNGTIDATGINIASSDSQFVVSGLSATTVTANGGTATFNVIFTPTASGSKSSTLTVSSSTSGSNSPTYTISGTGTASVSALVSTNAATSLSYNEAVMNGNVTTVGACPASSEKGFVYGTTSGTYGSPIPVGSTVSTGSYNYNLTSLSQGTTYYYKAYVKDTNGNYVYGSERSFTTLVPASQIAFVNMPTSGYTTVSLPAFSIEARTPSNTVDTSYSGTVSLSKTSGSGVMSGTLSNISFVNGIANFNDVKFDTADTYVISATAGNLPTVASGNIVITTGDIYQKITSITDLTDGDYIIADANDAVIATNVVTNGTYATTAVTVNNNAIVNTNTNTVWHITNLGSNYSIQNVNNTKYLAYSGSSTNLAAGNSVSDNSQKWIITYNTDHFTVASVQDNSRILKYNSALSTPGFKAYTSATTAPEVSLYKKITTTTWSSANGSGSWSNGSPSAGTDAIITNNYSTSSNPAFTARNITIKNGGVLEITSGNTINAVDVTIENGGNLIQRDGSTLNNTGTFNVLKTGASALNKYAFWSSPVVSQNLSNIYGSTTPAFITEYDTATDYFVNASSTAAVTGKAYSIKTPSANASLTFSGTPVNGNQTFTLSTAGNGFNLIGNPYASNLDLNAFYTANSGKISNTFYFWDNTSNSVTTQSGSTTTNVGYAAYNPASQAWVPAPNITSVPAGNTASIGQGFIVKATNTADTSLNFTNDMRVANQGAYFNKSTVNAAEGKFWLQLTSSYGTSNTVVVAYLSQASNTYDQYDSKAIASGSDAFYTLADAQNLIIQGRGNFDINDTVPVGAKHFESGDFVISMIKKEGLFNNGQPVFLHDKVMNTYTNLQGNSYHFTASAGEVSNRFEIVYKDQNVLSVHDDSKKETFEVYRSGEEFVVRNDKNIQSVEVYDASGRMVLQLKDNKTTVNFRLNINGTYVIKAVSAGKEYSRKIIK